MTCGAPGGPRPHRVAVLLDFGPSRRREIPHCALERESRKSRGPNMGAAIPSGVYLEFQAEGAERAQQHACRCVQECRPSPPVLLCPGLSVPHALGLTGCCFAQRFDRQLNFARWQAHTVCGISDESCQRWRGLLPKGPGRNRCKSVNVPSLYIQVRRRIGEQLQRPALLLQARWQGGWACGQRMGWLGAPISTHHLKAQVCHAMCCCCPLVHRQHCKSGRLL